MPVFTALMTETFGSEDPFAALVRNDLDKDEENVRVLPAWVVKKLEINLQSRQIAQ